MYRTVSKKFGLILASDLLKIFLVFFLSGTQKIIMHINLNYWVVLIF